MTGTSDWRLLAASVTGESHRLRGAGNQDAWRAVSALGALPEAGAPRGVLLLALADGAGSAPRAAEGAALACNAALAALLRTPTPTTDAIDAPDADAVRSLRDALAAAADAVDARARALRVSRSDFACTLLLARLGAERIDLLQLGDGVGTLRRGGIWERPIPACRGEHAGETVFVSSADPLRHAAVRSLPLAGIDAVALLSDGLEPLASDLISGAPHPPFFDPLARFAAAGEAAGDAGRAAELTAFLESARVAARSDDDRTLLLAVRPG